MPESPSPIAVVLPPREGFGPGAVGAVGLLVHRLARRDGRCLVLGAAPGRGRAARPFSDVPFLPVRPALPLGPGLLRRNLRYAAGAARALRRLAPALVEVHNRPEVALALADRLPGTPVALFLHNDPQGMRGAHGTADRAALLDRLARVVTVSAWLRDRLLDGLPGPPPRPPVVLPNCIDLAALPAPRPAGERERLILFAGRVVADKGADAFVDACAATLPGLPGWRAEIIGADRFSPDSPETGFLRALRPRAAAAGVRLRGYQPHGAVLRAMAEAAIVAVPSRWPEPFGLTALEAMASGAAVISSGRGGLPEVTGDTALHADPDSPGDLAAALRRLGRDAPFRAALAAAAQARARRFDVAQAAASLAALRREILGREILGDTTCAP